MWCFVVWLYRGCVWGRVLAEKWPLALLPFNNKQIMTHPPPNALDDNDSRVRRCLLLPRIGLEPPVVWVAQPLDEAEPQPPPRLGLDLSVECIEEKGWIS